MKIIDLLNKIANGEIDINNTYQFTREDYCTINEFFYRYLVNKENLNIEIIEEKKIPEKLNKKHFHNRQRQLANKINEIIDYLKSKGE